MCHLLHVLDGLESEHRGYKMKNAELSEGVKGMKSQLLTYLIRLLGTSLSGIGYSIEREHLPGSN